MTRKQRYQRAYDRSEKGKATHRRYYTSKRGRALGARYKRFRRMAEKLGYTKGR